MISDFMSSSNYVPIKSLNWEILSFFFYLAFSYCNLALMHYNCNRWEGERLIIFSVTQCFLDEDIESYL